MQIANFIQNNISNDLANIIKNENGKITVSSLDVAEIFSKNHKNVLQAIQSLECSEEFRQLNFQPSSYLNSQGKKQPCFNITRDGFSLLAMGFTGKEAMIWKEKFIAAFNKMEEALKNQFSSLPKLDSNFLMQIALKTKEDEEKIRMLEYAVQEKEEFVEELNTVIKKQQPKVELFDSFHNAESCMNLTNGFKALHLQPKKAMKIARELGYLTKSNMPTQEFLNRGWFTVKTTTKTIGDRDLSFQQTFFTGKGFANFREKTRTEFSNCSI